MKFLENIIIIKIFRFLSCKLFDIGSSAKGLGNFTQHEDNFNIAGCFIVSDGWWYIFSHIDGERVEIWGTIQVDVAYFVLDFGLYFVEEHLFVERVEDSSDLSHILYLNNQLTYQP